MRCSQASKGSGATPTVWAMRRCQVIGQRVGELRASDDATQHAHHEDLRYAALIEREHRQPAANQLGGDVRLQIGEGQHQARLLISSS